MEYVLAVAREIEVFEADVNRLLAAGWQLQGGVALNQTKEDEAQWLFAQGLIRQKPDSGPPDFVSSGEKQAHSKLGGF